MEINDNEDLLNEGVEITGSSKGRDSEDDMPARAKSGTDGDEEDDVEDASEEGVPAENPELTGDEDDELDAKELDIPFDDGVDLL